MIKVKKLCSIFFIYIKQVIKIDKIHMYHMYRNNDTIAINSKTTLCCSEVFYCMDGTVLPSLLKDTDSLAE